MGYQKRRSSPTESTAQMLNLLHPPTMDCLGDYGRIFLRGQFPPRKNQGRRRRGLHGDGGKSPSPRILRTTLLRFFKLVPAALGSSDDFGSFFSKSTRWCFFLWLQKPWPGLKKKTQRPSWIHFLKTLWVCKGNFSPQQLEIDGNQKSGKLTSWWLVVEIPWFTGLGIHPKRINLVQRRLVASQASQRSTVRVRLDGHSGHHGNYFKVRSRRGMTWGDTGDMW